MHPFAKKSFNLFKKTYLGKFDNPKIIDIGSLNVNGTLKNEIDFKSEYIGLDLTNGENVDICLESPYQFPIDSNSVDIVVSVSTFEHIEFFWETFSEVLRILKPNGLFFLNVPASGPFHRHPIDSWRFYPDAASSLVKWGKQKGFNAELLESFTHDYSNNEATNDFVAIFLKDEKFKTHYEKRIIDNYKNFTNGITNKDKKIINFRRLTQDQNNWFFKLNYWIKKKFYKRNN